ncbi:hypothetical protein DPX16_8340 [Anabarilius grahami]|uniref:Uncharacterized protein n=1 Tax=Anabarilius grahami TaxID=495550 RepID=A0A3N0ZAZ9_ANAGA|nr:hypothetical protein DPX16_8340 [Anabarilius grahami]
MREQSAGIVDGRQTRSRPDTETLTGDEENTGRRGERWRQYDAEQGRVLLELKEAAGATAQHTPHEQRNFYYDTVAGAASAFPVMSMR